MIPPAYWRELLYWYVQRPADRAYWRLAGLLPHGLVVRVLSLAAAATTRDDEHPGTPTIGDVLGRWIERDLVPGRAARRHPRKPAQVRS